MWEGGDCAGFTGYGVLRVIDGEIFIDDGVLLNGLRQFDGRKVMYEFVFPEEAEYEVDEKIRPLVKAMQEKGIRTLGSCQGHVGLSESGREQHKAYVGFYAQDAPPVPASIPEGWTLEQVAHPKVWRIVSEAEVNDESELLMMENVIKKATEFYQ